MVGEVWTEPRQIRQWKNNPRNNTRQSEQILALGCSGLWELFAFGCDV